jgi:hypothetical protein
MENNTNYREFMSTKFKEALDREPGQKLSTWQQIALKRGMKMLRNGERIQRQNIYFRWKHSKKSWAVFCRWMAANPTKTRTEKQRMSKRVAGR